MDYFITLKKFLFQFVLEIIFLGAAAIIIVISVGIFFFSQQKDIANATHMNQTSFTPTSRPKASLMHEKILVDISGAVIHPDLYEVTIGARIKDIITLAGGFSKQVDQEFFARNFNLAETLHDQEKIHIPTLDETSSSLFPDHPILISYSEKGISNTNGAIRLNINSATKSQMQALGVTTADITKIIKNRPYNSYDDLASRSGVKKAILSKIEASLSY